MLHVSREKSVSEYWSLTQQRDEFIKEWQDQVWDEKLGLDGIIAPVHAVPQLPHGYVVNAGQPNPTNPK
jgi:hypothetical protein